VITQSAMAFAQLLGTFSLIVDQYQSISSFAAVISRLDALEEAIERTTAPDSLAIETHYDRDRLAYERLTLRAPLIARLRAAGHEVAGFGAAKIDPGDDYPDDVIPLARAVASGGVDRGIVICGSGVGFPWSPTRLRGSGPVCVTTIIPSARGSKTT
jgi:hypothetical protein